MDFMLVCVCTLLQLYAKILSSLALSVTLKKGHRLIFTIKYDKGHKILIIKLGSSVTNFK